MTHAVLNRYRAILLLPIERRIAQGRPVDEPVWAVDVDDLSVFDDGDACKTPDQLKAWSPSLRHERGP